MDITDSPQPPPEQAPSSPSAMAHSQHWPHADQHAYRTQSHHHGTTDSSPQRIVYVDRDDDDVGSVGSGSAAVAAQPEHHVGGDSQEEEQEQTALKYDQQRASVIDLVTHGGHNTSGGQTANSSGMGVHMLTHGTVGKGINN
jgi:uncharacterized protein YndB with AHSA1/START domain